MATESVTVTLPIELVEGIEPNRSRFIAKAVEHELALRRRDGLLLSLDNPHPDAAEMARVGVHAWAANLPADEDDLVDVTSGTPVRWVEGQGWTEEP